jgi:DNA helicase HerA-like ATPase
MVGYDATANELFEFHVAIMGYYDHALGSFVNPWIPPQSGRPIYLAEDALLTHVLSKRQAGAIGAAQIGTLLTRSEGAVPIVLDVKELVSTHLAIIASTGAGKSYLASVILEELMRPNNRASVLIIDPHGEYSTLDQIANRPEFRVGNGRSAYQASVRVYKHDQVKVRISTLTLGDLRYLLPEMTEKQHYLLSKGYSRMMRSLRGKTTPWTLDDLKRAIAEAGRDDSEDGQDNSSTISALSWRLEGLFQDSFVFDPSRHLDLQEIFRPGQCTVLQLNEIDDREQRIIVATLLRRLNKARIDTERGKVHTGDEFYLPYPVFLLLEEAHHFAPAGGDVITTRILKQILAEGRKFGIGVGLISQRPGKLDQDVLSQCQTQCIMRIVNELDQHNVATAIEGVGRDLLGNLPALSKGQVIVAGSAVNTPLLCRVRPRLTPHGGESKDAPDLWQRYFSDGALDTRRRDASILQRDERPFSLYKGEEPS